MQNTLVKLLGLSLLLVPTCQAQTEPAKAANSPSATAESPEPSSTKTHSAVAPKEAWQPPTQPKDAEKSKDSEAPKDNKITVQSFLGTDTLQILSSPERVESFRMFPEPASKEVPDTKQLAGFPIEKVGPALTNDQIKAFQTLVLSDHSYLFEAEKRCLFRPDTGLRFTKGQNAVDILLSYSCDLWQFSSQGDTKTEDFDPVKTELLDFRKSLFSSQP